MAAGLHNQISLRDSRALDALFHVLAAVQRTIWPRRIRITGKGMAVALDVAGGRIMSFMSFSGAGGGTNAPKPLAQASNEDVNEVAAGLVRLCDSGAVAGIEPAPALAPGPGLPLGRLLAAMLPPSPGADEGPAARFAKLSRDAGRQPLTYERSGWPCLHPETASEPLDNLRERTKAAVNIAERLPVVPGDGPARIAVWIAGEADGNWALAADGRHIVVLPRIMNDIALVLAAWRTSNRQQG